MRQGYGRLLGSAAASISEFEDESWPTHHSRDLFEVTSTVTTAPTSATTTRPALDKSTIAGNFQTFLTLLTTQLKNQNPLDPLDTNQFTQQLVQFARSSSSSRINDQLSTLV